MIAHIYYTFIHKNYIYIKKAHTPNYSILFIIYFVYSYTNILQNTLTELEIYRIITKYYCIFHFYL